MRKSFWFLLISMAAVLSVAAPSDAEQVMTAHNLFDKLHGMWVGQLIGNAAGRATEGVYSGAEANSDPCAPWVIKPVWDADDDTDIEYLALHILETYGFDATGDELAEQWLEHISGAGIYIANRQAWHLMLDGHAPPETGSRAYNEHWYAIDAQIDTEVLGAVSPGMPQVAAELARRFGRITNAGFAVHAAQFYAVMYAEAFFEPNVPELISRGLAAIPQSSRTAAVVRDVLRWYRDDATDGLLDWRATRAKLYEKYQGSSAFGRYYGWWESTINVGATVLALLYGGGDFERTVQIAVLAGWDCDCNPATAGGLLGIIRGFSGLPGDLTEPAVCGDVYANVSRPGLPHPTATLPQHESITTIALRMLLLAHENVLRNGGDCDTGPLAWTYFVPEPGSTVADPEHPDPTGPSGLVGQALAAGLEVTPTASVQQYNPAYDRHNLNAIIDGVTDNSHNGHRPYSTYTPDLAERPALDWYELTFSQPVLFEKLVFHEGDIVWSRINAYYRDDEPLGGFFHNLTVEILRDGQYVAPADLAMSPLLDRWRMYQTITFDFAPTIGTAIRIIGTPGGSRHFTTILELEVHGRLIE